MVSPEVQSELSQLTNRGDEVSELLADALRETLELDNTPEEEAWIEEIEALRARLGSSTTRVSVTDYGAGSRDSDLTAEEMYRGRVVGRTVGEVARKTSKPYPWSLLLFKLIRKFKPSTCLELGTSLGISAAYQAAALRLNREGEVVTLEGAESSAALARENFRGLGLDNAIMVVGRFQDTLDSALDRHGPIDFAFIDGHHDEQATLSYFEQIYPFLSERAVLVFDDISWSEGMKRAWSTIEADERIQLSVGLSQLGICFPSGSIEQERNLDLRRAGGLLKSLRPAEPDPGRERERALAAELKRAEAELAALKSVYEKSERERNFFRREYFSILESRFWRYTSPARELVGKVRSVIRPETGKGGQIGHEESTARGDAPQRSEDGRSKGRDESPGTSESKGAGQSGAERTTDTDSRPRRLRQRRLRQHRAEIGYLKKRLHDLGFTERALKELQDLAADDSKPVLRELAAWELSLWYANQYSEEGARRCLELLPVALRGETDQRTLRQASIIEAECHEVLGDIEAAKGALSSRLASEADADLFLARASLEASPAARVEWVNKALRLHGVSSISYDASTDRPLLDSLRPEWDGREHQRAPGGTRVSVIMPVYNAEDVIHTALDSVLSQTWTDLEVLVVDDCSTDSTVSVVEEYVRRDPRVQLIKAEANGGPYVARNLALGAATGEFVTCHDTDDWSHPEKIERQVQHLLDNPLVIGNTSQQARATADLKFYRRGKPGFYIFSNMSSFMFRREPVLEAVGYWDCVRFGADNEFIRRVKRVLGDESMVGMPTGPLSFQRQRSSSLTGSEAFGFHGYLMGARKEYFEAHNHFLHTAENVRYEFLQRDRPFAIPEPMWSVREAKGAERRHFDVILASDFRLIGGSNMSNVEEIKAQKRMGLRTGLVQMSRYDVGPSAKVNLKIRELLDGDRVQMLVYGEKVSCDVLVLRYPPVLQEWQRFVPDVEAANVHVIVNQTPVRGYGDGGELVYTIARCEEHLQRYFGKPGTWHPIGPLVRKALHEHHAEELPEVTLAAEDWPNIIDVEEWRRERRPPRGPRPRIGRHSRDHHVKWPADRDELLAAYPASEDYEVHVLGGAKVPERMLGGLPESWRVLEFGEVHPKDFLSTLDVFVYYTHPDWVESFGRVILEAMAVGVPVILPPDFRDLFKEAAIYAEPAEVTEHVERLMADDALYKAQVKVARDYVEEHFGYTRHAARLMEKLDRAEDA